MDAISPSTRQAAILIASVDRRTADIILGQMEPAEAAAIRRATVQLDNITEEERQISLNEFHSLLVASPRKPRPIAQEHRLRLLDRDRIAPSRQTPGIDLLAHNTIQPEIWHRASAGNSAPSAVANDRAHGPLDRASSEALAKILVSEHPQTIAVVLSRLAPAHAADVLRRLPGKAQAAVVERLSNLDSADPQVLDAIERGLEARLASHFELLQSRAAGMGTVARILQAAELDDQRKLLGHVARHDRELATRLSRLAPSAPAPTAVPLTFDDLVRLDDATLATIVRVADQHVAILALAGTGEEVLLRLAGHLPTRLAAAIQLGVANLGATSLRDVEASQQRLVEMALELEAQSRIDLSSLRSLSVAA